MGRGRSFFTSINDDDAVWNTCNDFCHDVFWNGGACRDDPRISFLSLYAHASRIQVRPKDEHACCLHVLRVLRVSHASHACICMNAHVYALSISAFFSSLDDSCKNDVYPSMIILLRIRQSMYCMNSGDYPCRRTLSAITHLSVQMYWFVPMKKGPVLHVCSPSLENRKYDYLRI